MFIVLLTFADRKSRAGEFMEGHKAWLKQGFREGVFLVAGSLQPNRGGGILAHQTTREALQQRIEEDPFVAEGVVEAEVLEIDPARTDDRLNFLLA